MQRSNTGRRQIGNDGTAKVNSSSSLVADASRGEGEDGSRALACSVIWCARKRGYCLGALCTNPAPLGDERERG